MLQLLDTTNISEAAPLIVPIQCDQGRRKEWTQQCFFLPVPNTSRYGTVGRHRWAGHSSVGPRRRRAIWTTAIFFPKTKQDHRTAEPQAVIQRTKRATEQLYTYQPRNYLRDFACTRQQLPAERLYMNERIHPMQRNVAGSVMLYHRNSRKRNGELLISIKRGRKLSMISGSWICQRIHGIVATCWVLIDWKPPVTSRYMSGQIRRMRPAMDSMIELRISFYMFPMHCCKRPPKFQWPPWTNHHNPWEYQGSSFWQGAQPGHGWRHLDTCCTES